MSEEANRIGLWQSQQHEINISHHPLMPEETNQLDWYQSEQHEITVDHQPLMPEETNQVDLYQSQQQQITVNHPFSNDKLVQTIQRANGMPVLFIPSSDGQLAAVTVDGLQNLMPTDANSMATDFMEDIQRRQQDFRAWLFFLTSLVATISYTAGLTPPGGFWTADDKAKGYTPGASVMRDMSPRRYKVFFYSNATTFFSSLIIMGMLSKSIQNKSIASYTRHFGVLVAVCFLSVAASYISGTWENFRQGIYTIALFVAVIVWLSVQFILSLLSNRNALPSLASVLGKSA